MNTQDMTAFHPPLTMASRSSRATVTSCFHAIDATHKPPFLDHRLFLLEPLSRPPAQPAQPAQPALVSFR